MIYTTFEDAKTYLETQGYEVGLAEEYATVLVLIPGIRPGVVWSVAQTIVEANRLGRLRHDHEGGEGVGATRQAHHVVKFEDIERLDGDHITLVYLVDGDILLLAEGFVGLANSRDDALRGNLKNSFRYAPHEDDCGICGNKVEIYGPHGIHRVELTDGTYLEICMACSKIVQDQTMIATGRVNGLVLSILFKVANWNLTQVFDLIDWDQTDEPDKNGNYIYKVWFKGPHGYVWYGQGYSPGIKFGQVDLHCRRTSKKAVGTILKCVHCRYTWTEYAKEWWFSAECPSCRRDSLEEANIHEKAECAARETTDQEQEQKEKESA